MLDEVLRREREFHDAWAKAIDAEGIHVPDYFEACTAPENRFIIKHLGDMRGKYILDLGCGAGENSVYFAMRGAECVAGDYSPEMVQLAQELATKYGMQITGKVINAMAIDFPDHTFDIVYAANLLHHIPDPLVALREMQRVVKPGGQVCFWDPLIHNPVINIYRRMATQVRTTDETPLNIQIIRQIRPLFTEIQWDTFWLASLWIFLQFYLIEKVHPNQERYWKKIIIEHQRLRPMYLFLERFDRLLKHLPGMKRLAWNLAVVARK
ncbi:methyltransferase type 11 [Gloeomargarita lithophora Alchichica-D10]|uniref:Methyltransferase type 11 n=1 Tax=Gloeomargarita lithophora Alchichica-D10 TaxID=1188229 RepID=A0A1J0AH78_9CYAN|nr:class I SAM-dependent methyltransferase [Gloeomargarita lithophora]APB35251.1 methyltransferase type 11 [Gloeomargarita lithophora Alchichica-D10]